MLKLSSDKSTHPENDKRYGTQPLRWRAPAQSSRLSDAGRAQRPPADQSMSHNSVTRQQIEQIYRAQSRRVLATLIRLLNDFSLAEECLQEAFIAALDQWPRSGQAEVVEQANQGRQ